MTILNTHDLTRPYGDLVAARIADALALTDLDAAASRLVREYSGGMIRGPEIALGWSPTSPC